MSQAPETAYEPWLSVAQPDAHAAGVTLSIHAANVLVSPLVAARLHEQLHDVLARRLSVTVRITGLQPAAASVTLFTGVCAAIAAAVADTGSKAHAVELAVAANALSPQDAWRTRREYLADGAVYMLAGRSLLRPDSGGVARDRYDAFWQQLWRLRGERYVRAAYAPLVRSQCPLLSPETADTVVPALAIQAPTGSAWIAMRIDLLHFADARGRLDEDELQGTLRRCVDRGDALHEQARWATAGMRHDAWLNRRLAIEITGIGELVQRRQDDPRQFACLRTLSELLQRIQATLWRRSRTAAVRAGAAPALVQCDPARALPGERNRDGWNRRWSAALEQHATRHRNLLVLSPWSVFPANNRPDPAYLDLLPLLAFADACAFPESPPLLSWNINEFRKLHQRAWAIIEQNGGRQLIAEQV